MKLNIVQIKMNLVLVVVLAILTSCVIFCCSSNEQKAEQEKKPSVTTKVDGGMSWEIGTAVIDGHKYIYFVSNNGAAICPAKSDY